jgi:hypothetical protein
MTEKANGKLNLLKALSGCTSIKDPTFLLKLYKSLIQSIFKYGCIAYINAADVHQSKLQKIQNSALRSFLALSAFVSQKLLHNASGLTPIYSHLKEFATHRFNKLISTSRVILNPIKEFQKVKNYRSQMHCSPLDILYT